MSATRNTILPIVLPAVARALKRGSPVVALESTVITHGLPKPQNLILAREIEAEVRRAGAVPATIAVLDGQVHVGLSEEQIGDLAEIEEPVKLGRRDLPAAIVKRLSGGTTVAGTMLIAQLAGIRVFATGGIGGVHRNIPHDVSGDLHALADYPMIVVCAGAKAILDIPATLEYLETLGIPVVGYQTDEFPAFYSSGSGLPTPTRLDSPEEVAEFAQAHWTLGTEGAVLVVNPIPAGAQIPGKEIDPFIERAAREAREQSIAGPGLTPFLLERLNQLTEGRSLRANLALLLNNAVLAAELAAALRTNPARAI
jgi:pseudouridine-5'-phosphate glycosidase